MPPGSRVYFKFKSTAKFKTIDLADRWISVAELKALIAEKEGLANDDTTELLLSDPRTGEEYRDDAKQVAQNSSIVVRRVPVIRHDALQAKQTGTVVTVPGLTLPGLGPTVSDGAIAKPVTNTAKPADPAFDGDVYGDQPDGTDSAANPINEVMQRMVRQQAESHRQQVLDQRAGRGAVFGRGRGRAGFAAGRLGAFPHRDLSEFTCSWCGVKGDHYEKDCPAPDKLVKRIRHASGVPNGALAPSADGGLLMPNGQYGTIVPNTAGFQAAVAPMLSLTAASAPALLPAVQPTSSGVEANSRDAPAIANTPESSSVQAQPLALPFQPSDGAPALEATASAISTPQFAGDDLLEIGGGIFPSMAIAPAAGLPSLAAPMTPAEFEQFKQQQLKMQLGRTQAGGSRSDSRSRRSRYRSRSRTRSRSHSRSRRRSRSRSYSRRRYSRSSSGSLSRSRSPSRSRGRVRPRRGSHTHSRSRSPSSRRGYSRSSRSPGRLRDRARHFPAQFPGQSAQPVPAQMLRLAEAPIRHQQVVERELQGPRQHRLASSSRDAFVAPPSPGREAPVGQRQRSPVPRRPISEQRPSPSRISEPAAIPRSHSRRVERLQVLGGDLPPRLTVDPAQDVPAEPAKESKVLGGDLPPRFTVDLAQDISAEPAKRRNESKVKKEGGQKRAHKKKEPGQKRKHKKDHSTKDSKSIKRKREYQGSPIPANDAAATETRLSPARWDPSASPPPAQAMLKEDSQTTAATAANPDSKEPTNHANVQRIKANRPLFALALGDTKRKTKKIHK